MPLSRVLLQLCGLLLALAATAVSAGAPVYGSGEVVVRIEPASLFKTRREQIERCATQYAGVLLPAVTDAVHQMVTERVDRSFSQTVFGYMGGSSMSSISTCTTSSKSLDCIWSWDQGRYLGVGNEVPFYQGNRDPNVLAGAGMVGTAVSNHWRVYTGGGVWHPGEKMQRYGAYFRDYYLAPTWADTSNTTWSYGDLTASDHYTFCAVEQSTTTTTLSPANSGKLNSFLIVGLSLGAAVVAGLFVALFVCLAQSRRCCCFARSAAAEDAPWFAGTSGAHAFEPRPTASQGGGGMSRANSFRPHHHDVDDDIVSRSFHNGASSKDQRSWRSSLRDEDAEMQEECFSDDEVSMLGSQFGRTPSLASITTASRRPPGAVFMTMTTPSEVERDDWQSWRAAQSVEVYTAGTQSPPLSRRASSVSFAM